MLSIWIGLLGSYRTIPFLGLFSGGSQVTFVLSSLVFRRQGVYSVWRFKSVSLGLQAFSSLSVPFGFQLFFVFHDLLQVKGSLGQFVGSPLVGGLEFPLVLVSLG